MIRFEYPWLLLLLLALPALAFWRWRRRETRPPAVLWGPLTGLQVHFWRARIVLLVRAMPWLVLALALLALARPQQGLQQCEVESRGVDIMLALDISPSMRVDDMGGGSRLDVARRTATEFVRGRQHDRVGVVAFAGTAFTQSPLTLDHETLIDLIRQLDFGMAEDGTAVGMGLATSVQRLRESRRPSKVVVLLTDGESNRGAIDPITAAELASAMGIKVYTVLVGRPTMARVRVDDPVLGPTFVLQQVDVAEAPMIEIAKRTGGRFFRANDATALSAIYREVDKLERAPIRAVVFREYRDLGPRLLGWAALVLAFAIFSNATWAFRAP